MSWMLVAVVLMSQPSSDGVEDRLARMAPYLRTEEEFRGGALAQRLFANEIAEPTQVRVMVNGQIPATFCEEAVKAELANDGFYDAVAKQYNLTQPERAQLISECEIFESGWIRGRNFEQELSRKRAQ